jgi:molecular chaperone DnaJ
MTIQTTCPSCRGEGQKIVDKCSHCKGSGTVKKESEIEIKIPAGIGDGMRVRLTNEGNSGQQGGSPGHLYVDVSVKSHKLFERDESDLYLQLPISYSQAVLGDELEIPYIKGTEMLKIPAGTQNGENIVLRGKGLPRLQASGKGNFIVQIIVDVPTKPSKEHLKMIEELAKIEKDELSPKRKSFNKKFKSSQSK